MIVFYIKHIFKNGTGTEKIYRENGNLYHIKHFKNGHIDNSKPYTLFYDNGKIAMKYSYSKRTISWFYSNGNLFKIQQIAINRE